MITHLDENWYSQGRIDFEYKKYILLAYLQYIESHFLDKKLYPHLSEIIKHLNSLSEFVDKKKEMDNMFPKELQGMDVESLMLSYKSILSEGNETLKDLEQIVHFALDNFKYEFSIGKEMYEQIEQELFFEPIGIEPIEKSDGFFFIKSGNTNITQAYKYKVGIYQNQSEPFRAIMTQFVDNFSITIANTFESFKLKLIKEYAQTHIPAVYLLVSKEPYPIEESILPIAKRILIRYLS